MSNPTTTSVTAVAIPSGVEVIPTAAPLSKSQFNYTIIADMVATAYEKVRQVIITLNNLLLVVTELDRRLSAVEFKVYGPMDPSGPIDPPTASPGPEPQAPVDPTSGGLSNRQPGAYDASSGGLPALKRKK